MRSSCGAHCYGIRHHQWSVSYGGTAFESVWQAEGRLVHDCSTGRCLPAAGTLADDHELCACGFHTRETASSVSLRQCARAHIGVSTLCTYAHIHMYMLSKPRRHGYELDTTAVFRKMPCPDMVESTSHWASPKKLPPLHCTAKNRFPRQKAPSSRKPEIQARRRKPSLNSQRWGKSGSSTRTAGRKRAASSSMRAWAL